MNIKQLFFMFLVLGLNQSVLLAPAIKKPSSRTIRHRKALAQQVKAQKSIDAVKVFNDLKNDIAKIQSVCPRVQLFKALMIDDDVDEVIRLIEAGADVNVADKDGKTALFLAALRGHFDLVECLVRHWADINVVDYKNRTALYAAACNGYVTIVKYLVEQGADITVRDIKGKTARDVAVAFGYEEISDYLTLGVCERMILDDEKKKRIRCFRSLVGFSFA